jgi:hypothetical protein
MVKQRKKVCERCGSDDLMFDAFARWSPEKNQFILDQVFESVFCGNCNCETADIDINLDKDLEI